MRLVKLSKRMSFIIFTFVIIFVCVSKCYAGDVEFSVFKTNGDNNQATATRSDLKAGKTVNYTYYKYNSNSYDAFCLDAHVTYGGEGPYIPALNEAHNNNIYKHYLGASSDSPVKDMARGYILIGQFLRDKNYEYVDAQIALRLWTYNKNTIFNTYGAGIGIAEGVDTEYDENIEKLFIYAPNPSAVPESKRTAAQQIFDYAALVEENPYKMGAADGFDYKEGFWEAKYKEVDSWSYEGKEYQYKGIQESDTEKGKYTFDQMYRTNIRTGADSENRGTGLTCEGIEYNGSAEEFNQKFDCTIWHEQPDKLFKNRGVDYIHIKTKDGVYLDNSKISFKAKYTDGREANNFWIAFYKNNKNAQRFFITEATEGYLQIGEEIHCIGCECDNSCDSDKTTCSPNVSDKSCISDSSHFTIGDDISDNSCVFNVDKVNRTVSDTGSGSDKQTYTQNFNEYCSLTCAEKIDIDLPDRVSSVVAGQYWTWEQNQIKLTGTRVCHATVALDKYKTDLGIDNNTYSTTDTNQIKDRLTNDILKRTNFTTNNKYPLLIAYSDIKMAYDEYKNANSKEKDEGKTDSYPCGESTCYNCQKYSFTSDYTGEKFVRYVDAEGSCSKSDTFYNSNGTISEKIESFANKAKKIEDAINEKTNNVNICSIGNNETTGLSNFKTISYDFNPTIQMSYEDKVYGKKYIDFKPTVTGQTNPNEDNYSVKKTPITYAGVGGVDKKISYINKNINKLTWTKTAVFDSLKYYYMKYSNFSKGLMDYKTTESEYKSLNTGANFKIGNNTYPVSLNANSGISKFFIEISNIGVDIKIGKTVNRFGKLAKPKRSSNSKTYNSLEYMCTYNVKKDVCVDENNANCKPNFFFRNVSLNNFDPNNRTLGKNWNNEKGKATICEIDGKKYDQASGKCSSSSNNPEGVYEADPEYSFELTPDDMQYIKSKNREAEKTGNGYANWDMTAINTRDSSKYQKIWFTSNFIDDLEKHKDSIVKSTAGRNNFSLWNSVDKKSGTGPAWK